MNPREKVLSGLIGVIAIIGIGYFGWTKIDGMLQSKRQTRESLDKRISEYDLTLRKERRAVKALRDLQRRSLPTDSEVAKNEYFKWLLATLNEVGLEKAQVKPSSERQVGNGAYTPYRFTVLGNATLPQTTELLHRFYSSDDLHRISNLILNPNTESNDIRISLTIEAISIPGSPKRETVGDLKSKRLEGKELDHYVQSIVNRNLFAPANQAPVIKSLSKQNVEKGKTLKFDVADNASDPDKNDKLTYALVESP